MRENRGDKDLDLDSGVGGCAMANAISDNRNDIKFENRSKYSIDSYAACTRKIPDLQK
jgi:hypothetical protein